jgi:hypothetical protein
MVLGVFLVVLGGFGKEFKEVEVVEEIPLTPFSKGGLMPARRLRKWLIERFSGFEAF